MFRVLPGETVNQAAKNAAAGAQAYAAEDAYKDGFNPFNVSNISGSPSGNASSSGSGSGYSGGSYRSPWGGYGSSYSGYFDGGAGVLNASANIMDAQGRFLISNQQAVLMQEAVKRERLRNKRRVFDEWLYERANTPTLEQLRQEARALELSRARNDPPITEVYSGKSLNRLLDQLVTVQSSGLEGRPVKIEPSLLKNINVTGQSNGANFGMFKNRGKLDWPVGLTSLTPDQEAKATRKQIEGLINEALDQAEKSRVDNNIIRGLRGDVETLRQMLMKNRFDLDPNLFIEAKKYLSDLDDAVKVLPEASKYVNGAYALDPRKIKTVQDLVRFMNSNGLTFAPSVNGDEASYLALQRAMAAYDANSQAMLSSSQKPPQ